MLDVRNNEQLKAYSMIYRINVKLLFCLLIGIMLLGNIYTFQSEHFIFGKSVSSTKIEELKSKINQEKQQLRDKAAVLLAPCLALKSNPSNPAILLQCQAALNQIEIFLETESGIISGLVAEIQQILRNIH